MCHCQKPANLPLFSEMNTQNARSPFENEAENKIRQKTKKPNSLAREI